MYLMKKILLIMSLVLAFAINCEAQTVQETDYNTFSKKILPKEKTPIVIDFYATWCGPCKAMEPVIEKAAKTYAGKIKFYRVDVDKNQEWSNYLGISSIPTLVIYKNGGIHKVETGYKDYGQLNAILKKLIK